MVLLKSVAGRLSLIFDHPFAHLEEVVEAFEEVVPLVEGDVAHWRPFHALI
jgi:hypothetical protein